MIGPFEKPPYYQTDGVSVPLKTVLKLKLQQNAGSRHSACLPGI